MNLMVFKMTALLILAAFTFFISDFRHKKGMTAFVHQKLIKLIKLFYFFPIIVYVYLIVQMEHLILTDYIGLLFTFTGTYMTAKAKVDLGRQHAWAGHLLSSTRMVTEGIYAFIRHPLYTGIVLFIIGGFLISIQSNPFSIFTTVIIVISVCFIVVFLNIAAKKENQYLYEKFGEKFTKYKMRVHAFLPLKKYYYSEE